ncbi:MAG: ribosome-associated translation inhibitor RaiA [Phycisphaerales bacterium]|nr:ribosome-associated translation inhibitor RaiA [Phycisphaerales bacterium]
MQITVTGRHMSVPDDVKLYCEEKVGRLPRLLDRIQSVDVVIDGHEGLHTVEVIVHVAGSAPFVATAEDKDNFAALDLLMDKIEQQLRRYKERMRNRKHPPRSAENELPA